jgi:hypothetical protein
MASGSTPNLLLPYPLATDPVNVHGDVEALAIRLENLLNLFAREDASNNFIFPNTFNVDSAQDAVRITQTGIGNAFVVEDSTSPDTSAFVINNDGDVAIGSTSANAKLDVSGDMLVTSRSASEVPLTIIGAESQTANVFEVKDSFGLLQLYIDSDGNINGTAIPANKTLVTTDEEQTLTNKTIDLGDNTVSGTLAEFNTALSDADFATLDGTETLTNKTLEAPTINDPVFTGQASGLELAVGQSLVFEGATEDDFELTLSAGDPTADRTVTIPDADTTLVGQDTTDTLTNKTIDLGDNTVSGTLAEFNTALSDADFATLDGTETLTNKTLEAPTINDPVFTGQASGLELAVGQSLVFEGATEDDFELTLSAGDPTADRTVTIPDADTTLVGQDTTDTLTNKTIDLGDNTVSGTLAEFNTALSDADFATLDGTETLTNKTLEAPTINDPVFTGQASGLELAVGQSLVFEGATEDDFELTLSAGDPTADRTVTIPDADTTLVGQDTTDTLTNKTIDLGDNTVSGTLAEFNTALSDADFATLDGTETLTNKTLEAPTINDPVFTGQASGLELAVGQSLVFEGATEDDFELTLSAGDPTADRTVTIPDADTTLVGQDTTDTLTNKTIDLGDNTVSGTLAEFNEALSDAEFATLDGEEVLSNKTLGTDLDANLFKIINLDDPVNAQDAANKGYVDSVAQGLDVKESVKFATTENISLTSPPNEIDGISLITNGTRVLVKDQTDAKQNGIYVYNDGILARSSDADETGKLTAGSFTFVEEGNTYADTGWVVISNDPFVVVSGDDFFVGNANIFWAQFSGAGTFLAGDGLNLSGNIFSAEGTENRIDVSSAGIDISANYIGQDSITTLGTIETGEWQATTIDIEYGGTGATSAEDALNNLLPDQTSQAGKYLSTDGTTTAWTTVDALPNQEGNEGKFLTTDGTVATWETVDLLPDQTNNAGKFLTTDGEFLSWVDVATGGGGGFTLSETAPENPSEGDGWYDTTTGKAYLWYVDIDSGQWVEIGSYFTEGGGTSGAGVTASETPPASPSEGELWWNTTTGILYIYYDSFWVETVTGITGPAGPAGDPGIIESETPPENTDVIWLDTSESGTAVVPVGGTTGQVLTKISDDDYDSDWETIQVEQSQVTNLTTDISNINNEISLRPVSHNYIINGAFDVWQRGTSFSNPATSDFLADRWLVVYDGSGATRTLSRQAFTPADLNATGFGEGQFFIRYAQTAGTGGTFNQLRTRMEDVRTLAGQTATISFWAKAATEVTTPLAPGILQNFGSGGGASTTQSFGSAITIGTTWQRFTATATIPSISGRTIGSGNYLEFIIRLPLNNTTFTIDIWGVQLEAGSVATPFKRHAPSVGLERIACRRFARRYDASAAAFARFGVGRVDGANDCQIPFPEWAEMRDYPNSITFSSASDFLLEDASGGGATVTNLTISQRSAIAAITSTAPANGIGLLRANGSTGAFIIVSSEL